MPERQHESHVPVVWVQPVLAALHGKGRAHLARLLAHARDVKGHLALPVQNPHALVQLAGLQHGLVDVELLVRSQCSGVVTGDKLLRGQCRHAPSLER